MITQFKIFENDDTSDFIEYWKVPTSIPQLIIALNKIKDCELTEKDYHKVSNKKYAYVCKMIRFRENALYMTEHTINWYFNTGTKIIKTYENKFMGDIKVTKKDVEQYKIEQKAEKYNI